MVMEATLKITEDLDPGADVVLFTGDCLRLLPRIPDGFARLVVTSPPYNIGKPYERRMRMQEYLQQQRQVVEQCVRVLAADGSLCWQVGNYVENGEIIPLDIVLYPVIASLGLHLRNRIVWYFEHGLHARKRFSGRYEVILWFTKGDHYVFDLDAVRVPAKYPQKKYFKGPKKGQHSCHPLGKNPGDVWTIPNVKANHIEKTIHPCQFPVELVERLVLALTKEGDWVLDPFMGVGSTAIAALMHGRKAIGAEISAEYMKIARDRLRLAEEGKLRIRPMQRPVYDPRAPRNIPPQQVKLGAPEPSMPLFDRALAHAKTDRAA
jgi:adenine-specific DNA-methyltransferase